MPQDLSVGRQVSVVSVPARRKRHRVGGRWDVVLAALDSWPCTLRLCLILLVTITAPAAAAAAAELIRHMLLCGAADDGHPPAIPGVGSIRPVGVGRSTGATAGGRSTTRANGRPCCSAAGRCSVMTSSEDRRRWRPRYAPLFSHFSADPIRSRRVSGAGQLLRCP